MSDETQQPEQQEQPTTASAESPAKERERRPPRTLAEKLEELASSARARIDKLRTREHRLVQDLGKVRSELQAARTELSKITGAEVHIAGPVNNTAAPAPQDATTNGAPF